MEKKDILIIASGLILLAVFIGLVYLIPEKAETPAENVVVLTDKEEYVAGEPLKLLIENNKKDKICFSSCYPYYLQKKNGQWESYSYEDCNEEDLVEICIDPETEKAFELTVPHVKTGPHRILISACMGCSFSEKFRKEANFFSNDFIVK